jgi:hypothetical protein
MKRAITLAGGGPAAGLHIGVLEGLQNADPRINFDVWALSCIGAWVGIIYNQWETGDKADKTFQFFRSNIFRDDDSYSRFPINTVFGPDLGANTSAVIKFLSAPDSYDKLFLGRQIGDAFTETIAFWSDPKKTDRLLKVWGRNTDLEIGKTIYKPATLRRLMQDLRAAGLPDQGRVPDRGPPRRRRARNRRR